MILELIYTDYSNDLEKVSPANERPWPVFPCYGLKAAGHRSSVRSRRLWEAHTQKPPSPHKQRLYQPCGCQDSERTAHPQLPDKKKQSVR